VLTDNFSARFSPEDIDLSQNKSLRVLQVAASSIVGGEPGFLTHVLSTITSPAFSEVIVFYRDSDFHRGIMVTLLQNWDFFYLLSEAEEAKEALWYHRQFEVFREMRKGRDFRLTLCAHVWDRVRGYALQVLHRAIAEEEARRGFDDVFSKPLLIYSPRGSVLYF
jgi:hypothetical protein